MKRIIGVAFTTLAVGVALALPASASASAGFAADEYPATVTGSTNLTLSTKWGEVGCSRSLSGALKGPATSLSLGAAGGTECQLNGCELTLKPGSSSFDVGPPGCGPFQLASACGWIGVSPQTGLAASYSGTNVKLSGTGLTATLLNGGAPCGSKGQQSSATLSGSVNLTAVNGGGKAIGVSSYASNVPNGIYLANSGLEGLANVQAQAFPAAVLGTRDASGKITIFSIPSLKLNQPCAGANLSSGTFGGPTTQFSLAGTFSECAGGLGTTTVAMNSCSYKFENVAWYNLIAETEIACTKAGDAIEVKRTNCAVKIPAQDLGEATKLANQGSQTSASIDLAMEAEGVDYTSTGIICPLLGVPASGSDALVSMDLTLKGTYEG